MSGCYACAQETYNYMHALIAFSVLVCQTDGDSYILISLSDYSSVSLICRSAVLKSHSLLKWGIRPYTFRKYM